VTPLVEFRHIVKTFGGVHAVENVSLDLGEGEVLGLLGHNGAGKSTLVKILSGVYTADSGEILFAGRPVEIRSTRDAKSLGIETIYQTLALSENLDAVAKSLPTTPTRVAGCERGRLERMCRRFSSLHSQPRSVMILRNYILSFMNLST
jgi:ABC-type sugar transport system ATPase subunit